MRSLNEYNTVAIFVLGEYNCRAMKKISCASLEESFFLRMYVRTHVIAALLRNKYSQTSLNSTSYSRLPRIVLRPFPERKYRSIFVSARREIIAALTFSRERGERERRRAPWMEGKRKATGRRKEKLRDDFRMSRKRFVDVGRSAPSARRAVVGAMRTLCEMHRRDASPQGERNGIKTSERHWCFSINTRLLAQ